MFELVHDFGCFAAHEFNCILVAEPVRTFDRIVEMVVPIVFGHVTQRCADAALRRNSV